MPSFAFGSPHHHLATPGGGDSPYSVEVSIDGDSSDLDSLSEVDLESGGVTSPVKKLHSGGAHSKCAETWFKIKGNMTCEICGAMAINVAGEQSNQESNASAHSQTTAGQTQTEARGTWHGRRVMNFLLAVVIFAFIVSWLFHFKVLK
ncbi:RING/FYVE/PHD zinc finger superfamily protein [Raphanus sativus]|nr:RING/FYVE/PHD zinc finger superfamily protein [Raphanus sativus]